MVSQTETAVATIPQSPPVNLLGQTLTRDLALGDPVAVKVQAAASHSAECQAALDAAHKRREDSLLAMKAINVRLAALFALETEALKDECAAIIARASTANSNVTFDSIVADLALVTSERAALLRALRQLGESDIPACEKEIIVAEMHFEEAESDKFTRFAAFTDACVLRESGTALSINGKLAISTDDGIAGTFRAEARNHAGRAASIRQTLASADQAERLRFLNQ